jgi:hypothetical protein
MSLFHPRVIKKHINKMPPMDVSHSGILTAWAENLGKGIYDSETQNDGEFIQQILINVLGYVGSSEGKSWSVAKNQPINQLNVDVALGEFSADSVKIIAPFELKGAKTKDLDAIMAGRGKTPVQQAWEYANEIHGGSCQWVIVSNYREIRLYAFGYGKKNYESFNLSQLNDPQEYKRFMLLLSAENLLSGKTLGFLKESEQVDKDITNQLYSDYKALRANLIKTLGHDNRDKDPLDIIKYTQTILDRVLFVAFAEDKGLLPENTLKNAYETQNNFNPQPIWDNFKGLFHAIDKGNSTLKIPHYNGGLFAENTQLDSLSISDALCEGFKKIGDYDFDSDVSVNILGHIFEQSISDLEELKAHADNIDAIDSPLDKKQSKRKKDGIFYTPAYITRYIVEQAVGGWLSDRREELGFDKLPALKDEDYASIAVVERGKRKGQITYNKKIEKHIAFWEAYKESLSNIKVLDPACGSGAFLNEVFDYLKTAGEAVNSELAILKGEQTALFRWDTHILANNIYGVDLNNESVEITKLSLWLKTANRQEKLTYLENNIKCGNSLINDTEVAGESAFNWNEEFLEIMEDGGFDVIVGNPPYGAKFNNEEKEYFRNKYNIVHSRTPESFNYFIQKINELTKSVWGIIIPSSYLSQHEFLKSRNHVSNTRNNINVLNLGDGVFEDVATPTCIAIAKSSSKNECVYNDFRISKRSNLPIDIFKYDKELSIKSFTENIGSTFIVSQNKDLIDKCYKWLTLKDVAEDVATGISSGLDKAYVYNKSETSKTNLEEALLKKLIVGGEINRYFLSPKSGKKIIYITSENNIDDFPNIKAALEIHKEKLKKRREAANGKISWFSLNWPRRIKLFEEPKILIRQTANRIMAAYDDNKWYCLKSGIIVQLPDNSNIGYFYLLGLLNSKLMNFLYQDLVGETGRIFPEVKPVQLFKLPIRDFNKKNKNDLSLKLDIENNVEKVGVLFSRFQFLSDSFSKLLQVDFLGMKSISNWYDLEFSDFVKEIEKSIKPQKLSLSQKAEWMTHFETEKAKAVDLKNQIDQTDREIDQMVYALYCLTPEEIDLIEKTD